MRARALEASPQAEEAEAGRPDLSWLRDPEKCWVVHHRPASTEKARCWCWCCRSDAAQTEAASDGAAAVAAFVVNAVRVN